MTSFLSRQLLFSLARYGAPGLLVGGGTVLGFRRHREQGAAEFTQKYVNANHGTALFQQWSANQRKTRTLQGELDHNVREQKNVLLSMSPLQQQLALLKQQQVAGVGALQAQADRDRLIQQELRKSTQLGQRYVGSPGTELEFAL